MDTNITIAPDADAKSTPEQDEVLPMMDTDDSAVHEDQQQFESVHNQSQVDNMAVGDESADAGRIEDHSNEPSLAGKSVDGQESPSNNSSKGESPDQDDDYRDTYDSLLHVREDDLGFNYYLQVPSIASMESGAERSSIIRVSSYTKDVIDRLRRVFYQSTDSTEKDSIEQKNVSVVRLYVVASDAEAFAGCAILSKEQPNTIEASDNEINTEQLNTATISVEWEKLVLLPSADFDEGAILHEVLRDLSNQDRTDWDVLAVPDEELEILKVAIDAATEETEETFRAKAEAAIKQREKDAVAASTTAGDGDIDPATDATSAEVEKDHREDNAKDESTADKMSKKRDLEKSESKTSDHSMKDGAADDRSRRSRIPFNVIGMTYEEYCSRHYSLAIEQYRKDMAMQMQAGGMMPPQQPPMGMIGMPIGQYPMGGMMGMMPPMMGMMPPMMGMMPHGGAMPGMMPSMMQGYNMGGMVAAANNAALGRGMPQYNNIGMAPATATATATVSQTDSSAAQKSAT